MRALALSLLLLAAGPALLLGEERMNIHMVLEGTVTEVKPGSLTYAGTLRLRDFESLDDPYLAWMRQLVIEVNGVAAPLADHPEPVLVGKFYVYRWSVVIPVTNRLEVVVRDVTNDHLFFGGRLTSVEPPRLSLTGFDHYTDCGSAGSRSAEAYEAASARVASFDRVHLRRLPTAD